MACVHVVNGGEPSGAHTPSQAGAGCSRGAEVCRPAAFHNAWWLRHARSHHEPWLLRCPTSSCARRGRVYLAYCAGLPRPRECERTRVVSTSRVSVTSYYVVLHCSIIQCTSTVYTDDGSMGVPCGSAYCALIRVTTTWLYVRSRSRSREPFSRSAVFSVVHTYMRAQWPMRGAGRFPLTGTRVVLRLVTNPIDETS